MGIEKGFAGDCKPLLEAVAEVVYLDENQALVTYHVCYILNSKNLKKSSDGLYEHVLLPLFYDIAKIMLQVAELEARSTGNTEHE